MATEQGRVDMARYTANGLRNGKKKKSTTSQSRRETRNIITRHQSRLLEAIAGRIFPATDTPGAIESGATEYIEQALRGPYRLLRPAYRRGLQDLDSYAQTRWGQSFLDLSDDQKDSVLTAIESGRADGFRDGEEFFELVRTHVLEGVFGEPSYGGNQDMKGWRLIGFPGQQFGYPDPYINKVVDLSPVACDGSPKRD